MMSRSRILVSVNQKSTEQRAQIVRCLVEGNSIRATVRITGASKNTISKLLVELGTVCANFQDENLVDIKATNVQCDGIWSFVACKKITPQRTNRASSAMATFVLGRPSIQTPN